MNEFEQRAHAPATAHEETTIFAENRDPRRPVILLLDKSGSMGGAPKNPVWVYNLEADPDNVLIQDGPEPFAVRVRKIDGAERDAWWERAVAAFPPYAEYQQRTSRVIPVYIAERR